MQRVGAASEGFVEVSVDAQPFESCRQSAQDAVEPRLADRVEPHGASLADQQVWVCGVGPAAAAVLEPVVQRGIGEVVQWAAVSGDRESPVAEVHVGQLHGEDVAMSGGMDGGQGDRDADVRRCCRFDGRCDLGRGEWLRDGPFDTADGDAAGRVAEDDLVGFGPAEQRPQRVDCGEACASALGPDPVEDLVAGDLTKMLEAGRPVEQHWQQGGDVDADRLGVAGPGAATTVDEQQRPAMDVVTDGRRNPSSLPVSQRSIVRVRSSFKMPISASTCAACRVLSPRFRSARCRSE
ncbi:hypothetical protein [Micromonospora sp. CPCC 206061]|uniref:hypothetical protein n=1 Tax=Micromonospora sp. CPCC 206061 TaxID=3122410 RepID=UPI003FA5242C